MTRTLIPMLGRNAKGRGRGRGRKRGVAVVEYAFLLVIVAVPALVAIIAAGVQLADGYTETRNQVLHVGP